MVNKDIVRITCNGDTEEWERKKAISFYLDAICASDGHEQERYEYIVECLKQGDTEIDDDCV